MCSPICGDGITVGVEDCDIKLPENTYGCNSNCLGNYTGFNCTFVFNNTNATLCDPICGDGIVVFGEKCDDGNPGTQRGCNYDCSGALSGWNCTGGNLTNPTNCTLLGSL